MTRPASGSPGPGEHQGRRPAHPRSLKQHPAPWGHGPRRHRPPLRLRDLPDRIAHCLESEVLSGLIMVAAAAVALVWANSPWRGKIGRAHV